MAVPRRKRLNRGKRLHAAREWVATRGGRDLVREYARWYGVSDVCAALELRMLGIDVPDARLEQARRKEQNRAANRARRRRSREVVKGFCDADATFVFVAGYTEGGAPYGVEEEDAAGEQELAWRRMVEEAGGDSFLLDDDDDDLPF